MGLRFVEGLCTLCPVQTRSYYKLIRLVIVIARNFPMKVVLVE